MEVCEGEYGHLDYFTWRSSCLKFARSVQICDWRALIGYKDTFLLRVSRGRANNTQVAAADPPLATARCTAPADSCPRAKNLMRFNTHVLVDA